MYTVFGILLKLLINNVCVEFFNYLINLVTMVKSEGNTVRGEQKVKQVRMKRKCELEKKRRHKGSESVLFSSLPLPYCSTLNSFINIQLHIQTWSKWAQASKPRLKTLLLIAGTATWLAHKVHFLFYPELAVLIKKNIIITTESFFFFLSLNQISAWLYSFNWTAKSNFGHEITF